MARFGLPTIVWLVLAVSAAGAQEITRMAPGRRRRQYRGDRRQAGSLAQRRVDACAERSKTTGKFGRDRKRLPVSGDRRIRILGNLHTVQCRGVELQRLEEIEVLLRPGGHASQRIRPELKSQRCRCWNVNHVILDPYSKSKSKFRNEVNEFLKERINVTTFLTNEYFKSNRCHFIRARYYAS